MEIKIKSLLWLVVVLIFSECMFNRYLKLESANAPLNQLVDVTNKSSDQETNVAVPISIENEDSVSRVISPQPPSNERDFSKFFNGSSKRNFRGQPKLVVPISEINDMLRQSHLPYVSVKPHWPSSQVDEQLRNARKLILDAAQTKENKPSVYRNYSEFLRSYKLMEKTLKIYIYAEGEGPVFRESELYGRYSSEGWFKKQLQENTHFVTQDPDKAHLFYVPFGSHLLQTAFFIPNTTKYKSNMTEYLTGYIQNIMATHRFWNRTGGADHFLVACHDWAPDYTGKLMKNCIKALCNAAIEGRGNFELGKDVSLPQTFIHRPTSPFRDIGGKPPSQRSFLAFFAGQMHGYLRPMFLEYWEDRYPDDMKIFGRRRVLTSHKAYVDFMKGSKYCISVRGYSAYTPRLVEAIVYECVPVIIADNYVPPFLETLDLESFSVFVAEKDFPDLRNILLSISERKYVEMQERVKQVKKHFMWNTPPVKYDVFHMILHSIWYNRVFQMT